MGHSFNSPLLGIMMPIRCLCCKHKILAHHGIHQIVACKTLIIRRTHVQRNRVKKRIDMYDALRPFLLPIVECDLLIF